MTTRKRTSKSRSRDHPPTDLRKIKRIRIESWEDAVKDPLITMLRGAYYTYRQETNEGERSIAYVCHCLSLRFGAERTHEIVWKVLRIKQQNGRQYMNWATLYGEVPHDSAWRALGVKGIEHLAAVSDKKIRAQAIDCVIEASRFNEQNGWGPTVGVCYMKQKLTQLGAHSAVFVNGCSTKRKKATRRGKGQNKKHISSVTEAEMAAVFRDLHAALSARPEIAQWFSSETVSLVRELRADL